MTAIQIGLPVLLLAWLAVFPAPGILSYTVQAASIASVLLALGLVAMWLVPPWWAPYLYGLALSGIIIGHATAGRISAAGVWSAGWTVTAGLILLAGLGIYAGYLSAQALAGRRPPKTDTVDIAAPFADGTYLVAHGDLPKR